MIEWLKNLFASKKDAEEIETPESRALAHILDCVCNGELVYGQYPSYSTDINPFGISQLVVNSLFGKIVVSWYSSTQYRSISIDGKSFPYKRSTANKIYRAAISRSYGLLEEEIAKLDEKLKGIE